MSHVGKQIKEKREATGLSRLELGKRIGVTRQAIFYIEKRESHRTETLRRVADGIGCDVKEFF